MDTFSAEFLRLTFRFDSRADMNSIQQAPETWYPAHLRHPDLQGAWGPGQDEAPPAQGRQGDARLRKTYRFPTKE